MIKVNPAPGEQDAEYWKYQADLECSGNLADVISFMHVVNSDTELMKVDKFNFSAKKSDTDEIKATMTIEKIVVTDKPMPPKAQDANVPMHRTHPLHLKSCDTVISIAFSHYLSFLYSTCPCPDGSLKEIYERAVNAYDKQQYDQAMDLYQQIIKVVPTFAPAYNGWPWPIRQLQGMRIRPLNI